MYTQGKPQQEEEEHVLNQYFSLGLVLKRKGVVCYFLLAAGELKRKVCSTVWAFKKQLCRLIFFLCEKRNIHITNQALEIDIDELS